MALFGGVLAGESTLNPGDNLNLGEGTNTLELTITADGTATGFIAENIQNYNIRNFGSSTSASVLNFIAPPVGIESVNITGSDANGDTTVQNIPDIVNASLANGAGDFTLSYTAAAVAGSADVQSLKVENLTGGSFTAAGIETLNVEAIGLASENVVLSDNQDALTTVNISGGTDLELDVAEASVELVDGSSATGDLTLDVAVVAANASATEKATVNGGSGDDNFLIEDDLDADVIIDGNGGVNTLSVQGGLTSASVASGVSDVQVLKAVDTNAGSSTLTDTYSLAAISSVTTFEAAATTSSTGVQIVKATNFSDTDNLVISDGTNLVDVEVAFTTDTTTNALDAAINGVEIRELRANDAETVNLASNANPTSTQKNSISDTASFTDATSLVVSGSNELDIQGLALAEPSNGLTVTYDSTALTGKSTIVFDTAGNQVIKTGSNDDVITLKANELNGFDNIDLGGGTNTLNAAINSDVSILNIKNAQTVDFTISGTAAAAFLGNNTALEELIVDTGTGSSTTANISGIANNAEITATLAGTARTQGGKLTFQYSPGATVGNLVLEGTGATSATFTEVQVNNIATLNLSTSGAVAPTLSTFSGDALLTTLNIDSDAAVTLNASGSTGNLSTINASQSSGNVTVAAGVTRTSTATITGGSGNDNIGLNINTQSLNTIDAGTGTDTLTLTGTGNAAVTVVDLTSTTDQLVSINGQINSAVQKGFENFDASTLSATSGFGVNVTSGTGTTTVTTTAQADTVTGNASAAATYKLGAGIDVFTGTSANENVTGGLGGDLLTFGTGTDTATYTSVSDSATLTSSFVSSPVSITSAYDILTGLSTGDKIVLSGIDAGIDALTAVGTSILTSNADAVALVQGTFASGTFTTSGSGDDYLLQFANGANVTSVLLVDTGTLSSTIATGVITL